MSVWFYGEGNGNPLQCSCLENPRDGGVWWAAVYGVAQSWTRLKRLSRYAFILVYNLSYTTCSIFLAITLLMTTIISQEVSAKASKISQDR